MTQVSAASGGGGTRTDVSAQPGAFAQCSLRPDVQLRQMVTSAMKDERTGHELVLVFGTHGLTLLTYNAESGCLCRYVIPRALCRRYLLPASLLDPGKSTLTAAVPYADVCRALKRSTKRQHHVTTLTVYPHGRLALDGRVNARQRCIEFRFVSEVPASAEDPSQPLPPGGDDAEPVVVPLVDHARLPLCPPGGVPRMSTDTVARLRLSSHEFRRLVFAAAIAGRTLHLEIGALDPQTRRARVDLFASDDVFRFIAHLRASYAGPRALYGALYGALHGARTGGAKVLSPLAKPLVVAPNATSDAPPTSSSATAAAALVLSATASNPPALAPALPAGAGVAPSALTVAKVTPPRARDQGAVQDTGEIVLVLDESIAAQGGLVREHALRHLVTASRGYIFSGAVTLGLTAAGGIIVQYVPRGHRGRPLGPLEYTLPPHVSAPVLPRDCRPGPWSLFGHYSSAGLV